MSFSVKATSGGEFKNPSTGMVTGVCTRVIDWGTQDWGQFGPKRRVQISFEIDEQMDDGRPFVVSKMYTLSLNEKANLRKDLEGWRGKSYKDGEEVDLASVVGKPALLNLVEDEKKGRVNIASIAPLAKGMAALEPAGELMVFNLDSPDWDVYNDLHENTQEKIANSPEYKKAMGEPVKNDPTPQPLPGAGGEDFDDDIPF